jgi:hypothetical protein
VLAALLPRRQTWDETPTRNAQQAAKHARRPTRHRTPATRRLPIERGVTGGPRPTGARRLQGGGETQYGALSTLSPVQVLRLADTVITTWTGAR